MPRTKTDIDGDWEESGKYGRPGIEGWLLKNPTAKKLKDMDDSRKALEEKINKSKK